MLHRALRRVHGRLFRSPAITLLSTALAKPSPARLSYGRSFATSSSVSSFRRLQLQRNECEPIYDRQGALSTTSSFKARAAEGTATVEDAIRYLASVQAYIKTFPDLGQARQECRQLQAGGHALNWFREATAPGNNAIPDQQSGTLLCWFLVPERLEDNLWEWLMIVARDASEVSPGPQGSKGIDWTGSQGPRGIDWTHRLLGGLVDAHLQWAPAGSPDNALRCFRKAVELYGTRSTPLFNTVGIVSAGMAVGRVLNKARCPPATESLFDVYSQAAREVLFKERGEVEFARLILYHPSQPNATPFLQLLRRDDPHLGETLLNNIQQKARGKLSYEMLRASYVLRLQHRISDAAWLESLVGRVNLMIWDKRAWCLRELENDANLNRLREQYMSTTASRLDPESNARQLFRSAWSLAS